MWIGEASNVEGVLVGLFFIVPLNILDSFNCLNKDKECFFFSPEESCFMKQSTMHISRSIFFASDQ